MRRLLISAPFCCLLILMAQNEKPAPKRWFKGNLHTHTTNSDGDSEPIDVARWYKDNGYNFLVLTDHNYLTPSGKLNDAVGVRDQFVLIQGEEVTDRYQNLPIHVNGFNLEQYVSPQGGSSVAETIQNNVLALRKAKALPSLNHPNFQWAATKEDLLKVEGLTHFEVYNGHPHTNNSGGGGTSSMDELWDAQLSAGRRVYGIAVDDAHHFKKFGKAYSNPGQGWVQVRASSLDPAAISQALDTGDFYSSSGVVLKDVRAESGSYTVEIAPRSWEKITTHFIGEGGKILASSFDVRPTYRFKGNERYVRARVESSSGERAWTQPHFLR